MNFRCDSLYFLDPSYQKFLDPSLSFFLNLYGHKKTSIPPTKIDVMKKSCLQDLAGSVALRGSRYFVNAVRDASQTRDVNGYRSSVKKIIQNSFWLNFFFSSCDILEIRNGSSLVRSYSGNLSSFSVPPLTASNDNTVITIHFSSDDIVTEKGFKAYYTITSPTRECWPTYDFSLRLPLF